MGMRESLRVLIVDDHAVVREGIALALKASRSEVYVGQVESIAEAQSRLAVEEFDVAVIDIHLRGSSGLELVGWIRKNSDRMGVIVFSMSSHPEQILAAMDNGASGFLEKSAPIDELIEMIESAARNPLVFRSRDLPRALSHRRTKTPLTARELVILELLPAGATYAELSDQLFISESTLKSHLRSIYRKLNARNRVEAINEARRLGILSPTDPTTTAS